MSVHVQTGNMLDVVVEDGRLWLYLRHEKQMFLLEDPEGLRDVLAAEINRLKPAPVSPTTADTDEHPLAIFDAGFSDSKPKN